MQQNVLSPLFLGTLSAFESANNLLGFFAENGMSNANNDNSAISLGVLDTTGANIAYVSYRQKLWMSERGDVPFWGS